ncbi:MAG: hypothetical protein P4K86_08865 [Terracidiphilus sp.]|nr:hypothetical protein [Terracidiphilus sp.]
MPNFSKDNTAEDAYLLFSSVAREYDVGTDSDDLMLIAFKYAESPEAAAKKDYKIAKFFFPKYNAVPMVASILEVAQIGGKVWEAPPEDEAS